jgi:glutathione-regulated potassium-efflux system ancillary protein KefC
MFFDPITILCALFCGMAARAVGLPALLGYLAAGFVLHEMNMQPGPVLQQISTIGVTLLLFSIGLKLQPADLLEPKVWGSTMAHMTILIGTLTPLLLIIAMLVPGITLVWSEALIIGFALSFSSTVFAIQVLQSRGEMSSRHASLSIGVLLLQDIAAVVFIAASTGKVPEWSSLGLLLLIPLRPLILRLLSLAGHDELFTLFGLALAVGGAAVFELVGIKGDLGALLLGAMLAGDQKAKELAKNLLHFKDLFLVGFFVTIGLSGWPQTELIVVAILLGLLAPLKSPLYFWLMTRLHTPPRTALLSSAAIGNYSEFGLIVVAIASTQGMLDHQWSAAISLAIAVSFMLSSATNMHVHALYSRWYNSLRRFQSPELDKRQPDTRGARFIVLGMGNIGAGAYDTMQASYGDAVLGVDDNDTKLAQCKQAGRRVVAADASDPAFWLNVSLEEVEHVMLALTNHEENKLVGKLLRDRGYQGHITAIVRFREEEEELARYDIASFNLFAEAGTGFATHADALMMKAANATAITPKQ